MSANPVAGNCGTANEARPATRQWRCRDHSAILKLGNGVTVIFRYVVLFTLFGLFATGSGRSQSQEKSPSDLIKYLTYQSDDRRGKPISFNCGLFKADRIVAKSLANLGLHALPAIEQV